MTTVKRELYTSGATHYSLDGPCTQERIWLLDKDSVLAWDPLPQLGDVLGTTPAAWMFRCVEINIEGFGKPTGTAGNYAYEYYRVTCTYSTDHDFLPTMKWELSTETQACGKGAIWDDLKVSEQDWNVLIPVGEMTITRCVPEPDFDMLTIMNMLGHVNLTDPWGTGIATDTLLFTGCEVDTVYIPGKRTGETEVSVGTFFKCTYHFLYKNFEGQYNWQYIFREAVKDTDGTVTQTSGWHRAWIDHAKPTVSFYPRAEFKDLGIIFPKDITP